MISYDITIDLVNDQFLQRGAVVPSLRITYGPFMEEATVCLLSRSLKPELPLSVREVGVGTRAHHLRFAIERDEGGNITNLRSLISHDQILQLQKRCRQLALVKKKVSNLNTDWPKYLSQYKKHQCSLEVRNGVLMHKSADGEWVFVVPFKFLVEIMLVIHYQMSHIGRQKLMELVKQYVWNPNLSRVAGDVTRSCDLCQRLKVSHIAAPPIQKISTSCPFELVAMDLVALPPSHGYVACLVVMDHHTKWLSAVPVRNKTSISVAAAFEHCVLPFLPHVPAKVLTDNGPEFTGEQFGAVLRSYGISHIYTTPNKPSSNGLIERANRTLLELLRLQTKSCNSWYDVLPRATIVHNTTYHTSLKQSPTEYIYTNQHLLPGGVMLPADISDQWREGHPSFRSFGLKQVVLRRTVFKGREAVNKFGQRFEGPYVVEKANRNGVTYVLRHCGSDKEVRAHHSQLKVYHRPPSYVANHPYYLGLGGTTENSPVIDAQGGERPEYLDWETSSTCSSLSMDSFGSSSDSSDTPEKPAPCSKTCRKTVSVPPRTKKKHA